MTKFILGFIASAFLFVGLQAFAFAPSVGGHRTLALEDAQGKVLVEGGVVKRVSDKATLVRWIEAKIFDLQRQLAAMPKEECAK